MINFIILIFSSVILSKSISGKHLRSLIFLPVHALIGLMIFGYFYIFLKYFLIDLRFFYPLFFVVLLSSFRLLAAEDFPLKGITKTSFFTLGIAFILVFLYLVPVLIQSLMMSSGNYPAIFFNVDTGFYLSYVHAFIQKQGYPPDSLMDSVKGFNYHYGGMGMSAMIADFCGFMPHKIYLGFFPVLIQLSIMLVAYELIRNEKEIVPGRFVIPALIVFLMAANLHYIPLWKPLKSLQLLFSKNEVYGAQFPSMPSQIGLFIGLIVLLACQNYQSFRYRIILGIMLALLPIFKIPYMPVLVCGIFTFILYYFYSARKATDFIVPGAGFIFMLFNYRFFCAAVSQKMLINIKLPGLFQLQPDIIFTYLLFFLFLLINFYFLRGKLFQFVREKAYIISFIFPFILPALFIKINNRDSWQLIILLPQYIFFLIIMLSFYTWKASSDRRKILLPIFFTAIVLMPVFTAVSYMHRLLNQTETCYEYADNSTIADALAKIPVKHSKIALSDLRYPAENFKRNYRQFQASAIFGHSCFNAELHYLKYVLDSTQLHDRFLITRMLQAPAWNDSIKLIAAKHQISHLLVHKHYLHPASIPCRMIYENRDFRLYKF